MPLRDAGRHRTSKRPRAAGRKSIRRAARPHGSKITGTRGNSGCEHPPNAATGQARAEETECLPGPGVSRLLHKAQQLLTQQRHDKNKLYSLHAPKVECIGKGEANKKFEFDCKVSVARTSRNNWIVAIEALHNNPFDGHTLKGTLEQLKRLVGWSAQTEFAFSGRLMDIRRNQSCPIYVISLEHARERRETIAARLAELGLDFEFHNGVEGRKLNLQTHSDYYPAKRQLFYGRDLSLGEFGCVLAHRNIYWHMVKNRIARAVVLEDDAILTDDLPDVVASLCNIPETWDIIRFLGRPKNYQSMRKIAPLEDTRAKLAQIRGIPGGAYGYLLNLQAADRLLSLMKRNWLAIDTLHGMTWHTGLRTLAVIPSPVLPNDGIASCIDSLDNHARWDKRVQLGGWKRLTYPLSRSLWKFYLNCMIQYVWCTFSLKKQKLRDNR